MNIRWQRSKFNVNGQNSVALKSIFYVEKRKFLPYTGQQDGRLSRKIDFLRILWEIHEKINKSGTTFLIGTKLWWMDSQVDLIQNCIWCLHQLFKMAAFSNKWELIFDHSHCHFKMFVNVFWLIITGYHIDLVNFDLGAKYIILFTDIKVYLPLNKNV